MRGRSLPRQVTAHAIVQQFQADQGWNDTTLAGLLLDYIDNQQSNEAFEEFLQRAADENDVTHYDPRGIPMLSQEAKLAALVECVNGGHTEDALGHLFDLLHHLCPQISVTLRILPKSDDATDPEPVPQVQAYGSPAYFSLLYNTYGKNPAVITESGMEADSRPNQE